jgi:putative flippase GtrA
MDYEKISAGFCLYGDRGFTELNHAGKKVNTEIDNQYFIYSNISNLPDEWIDELHNPARWKPLRSFESGLLTLLFLKIYLLSKQKNEFFLKQLVQFLKFGIVGISNTLLTAATIWLLLRVFHSSNYLANIVGYVVGLVNSFIWNRRWTFENHAQVGATIFKFIVTFAISYLLQLGFLSFLLQQNQY